MATSLFDNKGGYTSQSKTPVYNGDILVTKSKGHTVAVVSGSVRSGSSRTEALEVDGSTGADGYIGVNSAKALQLWLNQQ